MFESLVENIKDVIYTAHPQTFKTLYVNKAVLKLFGYTQDEWINDSSLWEKSLHPDDKEYVFKKLESARNNQDSISIEYRIIRKDGVVRWVEDYNYWELDDQGKAIQINGFVVDITEKKESILVQKALIEKLERAMSEIKTLQGILPICSFCKDIRNDDGYYEQIESYLQKHSDVDFSHTICPECVKKNYPDLVDKDGNVLE